MISMTINTYNCEKSVSVDNLNGRFPNTASMMKLSATIHLFFMQRVFTDRIFEGVDVRLKRKQK